MTKPRSRLLEAVHESARDLYEAGVIDARRMREYDALCLPVPDYSAKQIKALRLHHHLSQAAFARVLNISPSAIRLLMGTHMEPKPGRVNESTPGAG
jgi:putative transcriptional regulator